MKTPGMLVGALLCASWFTWSSRPAHADTPPPEAETRISVALKDQTLRDALRQIAAQTGLQYRIEADVPNPRLSMNIRDISPEAFLRLMLRQASFSLKDRAITCTRDKMLYVIKLGPAEVVKPDVAPPGAGLLNGQIQDPRLNQKLTFQVKEEPFERVAERIFRGTGAQYQLRSEVRKLPITLSVREVSALAVARLVVRQIGAVMPGADFWRDGDVYVFGVAKPSSGLPGQP